VTDITPHPDGQRAHGELDAKKRPIMNELWPRGLKSSEMKQSNNVGDCYLLSALHLAKTQLDDAHIVIGNMIEMAHTEHSAFVRKHAQLLKGWDIHFPDEDEPITVYYDETDGQIVIEEKAVGGQVIPEEVHKIPVDGDLGDVVLERAYARLRKRREYSIAEFSMTLPLDGGFSHNALLDILGRENFSTVVIESYRYGDHERGKTGLHRLGSSHAPKTFDNGNPRKKEGAITILEEAAENSQEILLTASTPANGLYPNAPTKPNHHKYIDEEMKFPRKHAYAITSIRPDIPELTLINPHDTSKPETVSYDFFFAHFDSIKGVRRKEKPLSNSEPSEELGLPQPAKGILPAPIPPLPGPLPEPRWLTEWKKERREAENERRWAERVAEYQRLKQIGAAQENNRAMMSGVLRRNGDKPIETVEVTDKTQRVSLGRLTRLKLRENFAYEISVNETGSTQTSPGFMVEKTFIEDGRETLSVDRVKIPIVVVVPTREHSKIVKAISLLTATTGRRVDQIIDGTTELPGLLKVIHNDCIKPHTGTVMGARELRPNMGVMIGDFEHTDEMFSINSPGMNDSYILVFMEDEDHILIVNISNTPDVILSVNTDEF